MITKEILYIPGANLGEVNPLPDIHNNTYIHAAIEVADAVSAEERKNIGKGMIPTLLPYMTQDRYDRGRNKLELPMVVLENEYLRAEFLPSLGGRLRRLYDKEHDKELLYVNPVFQPGNLALRNAWFSGGVEFNVGIKGHNPLTCSPVFAERRVDADGQEYVSFYEYERIRGIVWSVNAYLPEGARALTLRCCIENCADEEKYMYWWSNIAVEESDGLRVIVPTREAFVNYFGNDSYVLDKGTIPNDFDTDVSYPGNLNRSLDFFYKIPEESEKWIASPDKDGYGLLHYSDKRLYGRKLFLWGRGAGGVHWGEYLAEPGPNYVEIQAGLAHTQLEHFPMEGKSQIMWVESYSALAADPAAIHGEWDQAIEAVSEAVEKIKNEKLPPQLTSTADLREKEMLYSGSGWGALEERVRSQRISRYFDFTDCGDPETEYYKNLLAMGTIPAEDPQQAPLSYVTGAFWRDAFEKALEQASGDTHGAYLRLGVTLYEMGCKGDQEAMERCVEMWEKSMEACPNPWAVRNLASFYGNEKKDYAKALPYARQAISMKKDDSCLAVDCCQLFLAAGEPEEMLEIYHSLPAQTLERPRLQLLKAMALLDLNRPEEAALIINEDFVMPDIKEGEISVSALWFRMNSQLHNISLEEAAEKYPLPYKLDFRTH